MRVWDNWHNIASGKILKGYLHLWGFHLFSIGLGKWFDFFFRKTGGLRDVMATARSIYYEMVHRNPEWYSQTNENKPSGHLKNLPCRGLSVLIFPWPHWVLLVRFWVLIPSCIQKDTIHKGHCERMWSNLNRIDCHVASFLEMTRLQLGINGTIWV